MVYLCFEDPCAGVRCGNNAHCVSGHCYCVQGYEGDANVECRPVSTSGRLFMWLYYVDLKTLLSHFHM